MESKFLVVDIGSDTVIPNLTPAQEVGPDSHKQSCSHGCWLVQESRPKSNRSLAFLWQQLPRMRRCDLTWTTHHTGGTLLIWRNAHSLIYQIWMLLQPFYKYQETSYVIKPHSEWKNEKNLVWFTLLKCFIKQSRSMSYLETYP